MGRNYWPFEGIGDSLQRIFNQLAIFGSFIL